MNATEERKKKKRLGSKPAVEQVLALQKGKKSLVASALNKKKEKSPAPGPLRGADTTLKEGGKGGGKKKSHRRRELPFVQKGRGKKKKKGPDTLIFSFRGQEKAPIRKRIKKKKQKEGGGSRSGAERQGGGGKKKKEVAPVTNLSVLLGGGKGKNALDVRMVGKKKTSLPVGKKKKGGGKKITRRGKKGEVQTTILATGERERELFKNAPEEEGERGEI